MLSIHVISYIFFSLNIEKENRNSDVCNTVYDYDVLRLFLLNLEHNMAVELYCCVKKCIPKICVFINVLTLIVCKVETLTAYLQAAGDN